MMTELIPQTDNQFLDILTFIKSRNYSLDSFMIDRFWASLNDEELIYIDDVIVSWMGYAGLDARSRKKNFTYSLDAYKVGVDYFEYSNDEYDIFLSNCKKYTVASSNSCDRPTATTIYPPTDRSQGKGKTKHLLLTPNTLRQIMMTVTTAKGKQVRAYYIALERLIKDYCLYTRDYAIKEKEKASLQLQETAAKLQLAEVKNFNIQNFITNVKRLEKNEIIYICTNEHYASRNTFKIGRAGNPKTRLSVYNTGRISDDKMYYALIIDCHDSRTLEKRIMSKLSNWRINKKEEMFVLNYHALEKIVKRLAENEDQETDDINDFMEREYNQTLNLPPFIPPPIELSTINRPMICAPFEDVEELMLTVRMPISKIHELIKQLIENDPHEEYRWKDLSEQIKNVLANMRKSSAFRAKEWQPICDKIIKDLGKTLSKK